MSHDSLYMVMINKEWFKSGDIITSMGDVGMRLNDLENSIIIILVVFTPLH